MPSHVAPGAGGGDVLGLLPADIDPLYGCFQKPSLRHLVYDVLHQASSEGLSELSAATLRERLRARRGPTPASDIYSALEGTRRLGHVTRSEAADGTVFYSARPRPPHEIRLQTDAVSVRVAVAWLAFERAHADGSHADGAWIQLKDIIALWDRRQTDPAALHKIRVYVINAFHRLAALAPTRWELKRVGLAKGVRFRYRTVSARDTMREPPKSLWERMDELCRRQLAHNPYPIVALEDLSEDDLRALYPNKAYPRRPARDTFHNLIGERFGGPASWVRIGIRGKKSLITTVEFEPRARNAARLLAVRDWLERDPLPFAQLSRCPVEAIRQAWLARERDYAAHARDVLQSIDGDAGCPALAGDLSRAGALLTLREARLTWISNRTPPAARSTVTMPISVGAIGALAMQAHRVSSAAGVDDLLNDQRLLRGWLSVSTELASLADRAPRKISAKSLVGSIHRRLRRLDARGRPALLFPSILGYYDRIEVRSRALERIGDVKTRLLVRVAHGRLGPNPSRLLLEGAAASVNLDERVIACVALGVLADARSTECLARHAAADPVASVREIARWGIAEIEQRQRRRDRP